MFYWQWHCRTKLSENICESDTKFILIISLIFLVYWGIKMHFSAFVEIPEMVSLTFIQNLVLCMCVCFQQENYLNNMYIMSENYLSIFFGERSVWVSQMMIKLAKCTLASMWLETNDTKISQDHLLADVKKQFNKNQHYLFFLNPPHMVYIFKRLLYTHIFMSFLCGK